VKELGKVSPRPHLCLYTIAAMVTAIAMRVIAIETTPTMVCSSLML
jgi:hypothetical protein